MARILLRRFHVGEIKSVKYSRNHDWNAIYDAQQPLVFEGLAETWAAVTDEDRKWINAANLLRRLSEDTVVSVETGNSYMDPNVRRVEVPFVRYLELLQHQEENPQAIDELPPLYLAQNELKGIPPLFDDVEVPELCNTGKAHLYTSMLWLNGIRGAFSPCHYDPFHNVLVQIYGEKEVTLFSPDQSNSLYPAVGTTQKNTSKVDIEHPDFVKFPNARQLVGLKYILKPGDAMYIPYKWWHFCRSRGKSCSVNFWWLGGNETNSK